ncbi:hypothetical protein G4G28_03550 [Massilia sp. Dwa41.01b]|uniref:hypothetical protein n=1 Tax=Massilia sp. Dwa41.01b TaxID=2709302 RepID=UPI0015FFB9F7|nr:hypothetical protein [Massilia sp. Dwa41.01b]QNA87775.1 hypothetical protein G4G28_03550 [Massilia sp. Dwa41.01b]
MSLFGASQLAALALAGLQATAMAAPCGCAPFAPDAEQSVPAPAAPSPEARTLRDFVLFAHRRIGADLIRQQGPYLDTVSTYLSSCPDETLKRAWLRRALAATSDTSQFAERIAHAYEQARACPPPAQ